MMVLLKLLVGNRRTTTRLYLGVPEHASPDNDLVSKRCAAIDSAMHTSGSEPDDEGLGRRVERKASFPVYGGRHEHACDMQVPKE